MSLSSCSQRNKWSGWISPVCISGKLCQVYYLYHFLLSPGSKLAFLWCTKPFPTPSLPELHSRILCLHWKSLTLHWGVFSSKSELWSPPCPEQLQHLGLMEGRSRNCPFHSKHRIEVPESAQLQTSSSPAHLCLSPHLSLSLSPPAACSSQTAVIPALRSLIIKMHSLSRDPGIPPAWGSELWSFLWACSCLWCSALPSLGFNPIAGCPGAFPWLCQLQSCPWVEQGAHGGVGLGWVGSGPVLYEMEPLQLEPGWSHTLVSSDIL